MFVLLLRICDTLIFLFPHFAPSIKCSCAPGGTLKTSAPAFVSTYLVVLSKWNGVSLHVQDAGDGVTLAKRWKWADQFASMVQVPAVGTIQPHVRGGMVVVIFDRPPWNAHARALVASVLFGNVELRREARHVSSSRTTRYILKKPTDFLRKETKKTPVHTFHMKQPEVTAVVARP